jgi:glycoside/pentoside/hexuronide:cation symporter, GPH family
MAALAPKRLGLIDLVVLSSPMVAVQLIEVTWRVYLPGHLAASTGLSLSVIGGLLLAMRLFDSVIDPAIAWASDRFPTRYGHRRPWMAASVAPIVLGTLGVFFPWPALGFGGLVVASLLLHAGFMMLVTPHGGWMLEYSADRDERLRIVTARSWVAGAGMIAVVALPALLERAFGLNRAGQIAALGCALLVACPVTIAITLQRHRETLSPAHGSTSANPFALFAQLLKARAMRRPLLLYVCSGFGEAATAATTLFFLDDAIGLEGWGSSLLLLQYAIGLIALPFWSSLADRIGRTRLLLFAYAWQAAIMPLAFLLPAGKLAPAVAFVLGRGVFAGIDFVLLRAIVADVARGSAEAGMRNGATCYALGSIALKIAMGAGAWAALTMMDLLPGLLAPAGLASGGRLDIRVAFAIPSMAAALCAILLLRPDASVAGWPGRLAARRLARSG